MTKAWFGVKSYGVGLTPKSAWGWVTTGIYVAAMMSNAPLVLGARGPVWLIPVVFALLTGGFLFIVLLKNDHRAWRWRWGGDSSTD